jgi:hypothetical protein
MDIVTPTAGAPPPSIPLRYLGYLFAGLLVLGLLAAVFRVGRHGAVFAFQITALAVASCSIPTVAKKISIRDGRPLRILIESFLFLVLMLGFKRWIVGAPALGGWTVYAAFLVLGVEVGGHLVEHYQLYHLERIPRDPAFEVLKPQAANLVMMFRRELLLYLAVPLGLAGGLIYSLMRGQTGKNGLIVCVQFVLAIASMVLIFFVIVSLIRISGLMVPAGTLARTAPSDKLKVTYMITDLRKVYLYDGSHNLILLGILVCVAVMLKGAMVAHHWPALALSFGGGIALLNELPYIIGQMRLHEEVLAGCEGDERADLSKKLKENAPTAPKPEFVTALLANSVGGSLFLFLAEHFVTEVLKGH